MPDSLDQIKKKPSVTDRIEIFAQAIVDGKTQADAYRAAYPVTMKWKADSVHHKASEMARNVQVMARIEQLRKEIADKGMWSREQSVLILCGIAQSEHAKDADRIKAVDKLNVMFGYNAPVKIDHSSTDGTMSPVGLDVSKLSDVTMKELLDARGQQ